MCCMCSCQNCISCRTLPQGLPFTFPYQNHNFAHFYYHHGASIGIHQKTTQGRGRGLLMVWRKELAKKLGINRYLPGWSRGATLAIMIQMDECPGSRPGIDQETRDQETFCNYDHGDIKSTTQYHQLHPQMKEAPQRLPITWPWCLGRGAPVCSFLPSSPTPSSTSSNSLETTSLESLTKPESVYGASVSSDLSYLSD